MAIDLKKGQTVFFSVSERTDAFQHKRYSSVYETRTVILRGEVVDFTDKEMQVKLTDNNGFEKDGETFVFNRLNLLCEQNYKDISNLGQWRHSS